MNLIPYPSGEHQINDGKYILLSNMNVTCMPKEEARFQLLQDRLSDHCKIQMEFNYIGGRTEETAITVIHETQSAVKEGAYSIEVKQTVIEIRCGDEEGLGYALVTLFHLFREGYHAGKSIACQHLEDWPGYRHRGQHIDTVRHFFSVAEIKRIVEQLSLLKFNALHWVFANDQAWRLQSKAYPLLTERCQNQSYSWEEVRELVAFAQVRGIKIIPEFEIPGHSSAAIAAYPELCCTGEAIEPPTTGGIFPYILCAGKQETYKFIDIILKEICELFPGDTIHLGGDEAPKDEWEKCPHCQKKMKEEGLESHADLQGFMLNYANSIVKKYGRKAHCWNESLMADNVDKDITVQFWSEMGKKGYSLPEITAGRPVIFSNFRPFYFDYPFNISNLKEVYNYNPKLGKASPGESVNIAGFESAIWTEHFDTEERLEYLLFPRVTAIAELAWGRRRSYIDFRSRLLSYFQLFSQCGIRAASIAEAEVSGVKRFIKNVSYTFFMIKFIITMTNSKRKMRREAR